MKNKGSIIWKIIVLLFLVLSILGRTTRSMHTMSVGEEKKLESQLND